MGSHKRSFQCFDAILDDPSLKPSLSYGHQSAGSHMSSAAFNRLEPLEDRGCYLCADHQQATSMTSEASGANSTPWYHFQTHPHSHRYMTRRPARPEETTGEFEDHHYHHHKHSSRIVLVKNSDPSVRRTIVLHRRSLRSLGLFMDEVSELMQCLIRKLYTLDGNKVDSVQSLLHCVGILVCVGREPFHPLLLDSFRKNSNDKLPKLNIKSRSSAGSDDNGAKKNVNFGLETKRSIIHPRCDSSNRSARLASSEKLFPNGLNSLPPGHAGTCPRAREGMMDDDIEKRVLVNKDGSLSMEMKVRFRLLHDETLHWSTEIKKSTSTLNECHTAHDDACCLSYGSADSCSEVESLSAGEAEETYNTKRYQKHFEEPHCYHCCAHCQEYDIWKNPILPDQTAVRHIRSSSSSASSRKLVCKKASTDSMHTMSSEEYTEHVVEKVEQTFGNQSDTSIKHCTIHCCCRQSQVCLVSAKPKSTGSTEKKYKVPEKMEVSDNDENKPDNSKDSQKEQLSVQIAQPVVEDERPLSTISSSSQILASFKEDQDEEDVDILPSISRASLDSGQQEDEDGRDAELNPCSATRFRSLASMTHLSPKPPNKTSPMGRSILFRKLTPKEIDVDQDDQNVRAGSAESAPSEALLGPKKFKCLHSDHTENNELMANDQQEEDAELKMYVNTGEIRERTNSEISTKSKTSTKSPSKLSLCSQDDTASENSEEHQDITDERSSSAISIKSNTSDKSGKSNVAEVLEQECPVHDERAPSAISIESRKSENSKSEMSETLPEDPENEVRTSSAMSGKSATSVKSKRSKISENNFDDLGKLHNNVEERTMSAMSCKSNISAKSSWSKEPQSEENKGTDEQIEEGASSVKSAMSNRSGIEELKDQTEERASSAISLKSNTSDRSKMSVELSELEEQEQDRVSVYSHISQKSKSEISEASSFQVGEEKELQERTASAMSATSVQSLKTTLSDVLPATTVEPHNGQPKERAQSVMSTKSSASQVESELPGERSPSSMSSISHISATSKVSEGDKEQIQAEDKVHERASSAISAKSNISSRSRKSETTPSAIERSGEDMKERTLSAMSSQSKASLRSNKSKVSSVAHEEHVDTGERGKRASSTMSTKSEVSTDVELEQRASSAISAKSNPSATLERSKMSMVGEDEVKKLQVQDDDQLSAVSYNSETLNTSNECEEKEERTPSALSTKSKTSVKSNKSKAAIKIVAEEHDLRSASTMSSKSVSAKFAKSEVSELVLEEPVETDDQIEGRTQSALSAKSNESGISVVTDEVAEDRPLSDMSSISNASKRSKKSNSKAVHQTKERAQSALSAKTNVSQKSQKSNTSATADKADDKEKEERAQSAMSEQSCISTKSGISTKSEAFTISEVSLQEPDDTEREDKTPSVMSIKSSVSARSHKSTNSYGGPAEVEVHNSDRLSSAISSISNISTKSGRSITPESTHSEKETTIEPDIKERALSAMSAKSISSGRTRTSKVTEIITDEPTEQKVGSASTSKSLKSNASGRSKKSNVSEASPKNVVNEDKEKEERAASVLSSLSNVSERTKHSEIIPDVTGSYIEERAPSVVSVTSVKSKSSNISGVVPEETEITGNKDAEASVNSSNALANSNASTRSKRSFSEAGENEKRSISVLSSASAESKVSKADVEKKSNRSTSQLSAKSDVSARSKKSKVSEGKDNTPTNRSPVSGHSKVSQADSNKCVCGAVKLSPIVSSEKEEEIPASPLSTKSKISSAVTTSERALTQTSTSVSIGIVDDCEVDDEGTTSVKSKTSASSETCDKSQKDLLESQRQMTKDRAITLAKSNISERSKSKHSHCSSTALDTNQRDEPSANDSVRQNFPTQEIRSSNKASSVSVHSCAGIAGQGPAESPDASHKSQSICSKCSSTQNRGKTSTALVTPTSPVSSASAVSDSKGSRKNKNSAEIVDRPNRNISKSSHLQVNDTNEKIHVEATVNSGDSHSGKSKKKCKSSQTIEEDRVRCHSATLSLTSANRLSPSPPKSPKKSKKTIIQLVGSKDSVLSQTVPDQSGVYIENKNIEQPKSNIPHRTCNGRPDTTDSIQNVSDKSEKSSKCRKRKGSTSSHQMMKDDAAELSPSCLPNSSPTEVVNEWLMKIPSDTALCDLEDEYHENFETTESLCTSHVPSGDENEHRDLKEYDVIKPEKQNNVDDAHPASAEGTVDKKSQENHAVHADDRKRIRPQAGEASKALDSSVLVMKVLLSPTIDRCNSLPEVSPVYGRKLSTSAQGLLDCLAKLQLLDFGPSDENSTKAKYQELMNMLKSLWLCDPKDSENFKDQQPLDEEFKARSSSGVDVNSGSTSSGKSSVLGCSQTKAECEGPDTLTKVQEVDETVQEEPSETPESKCKSATPYISCRARRTPEGGAKGPVEEKLKDDVTGSDETIRNNDSPRELMETPLSSNMSSGNYPQNKETETDHPEDSSSGSRPASQRPQLSKRVSQDPDPIWVLNLLNKLEMQFMTHYVNAMDEFKVRWNLDDNEHLDVMICELQDEVCKRIQCSVNRELKKIRGRAGRSRPPKEAMSRESTVQTEQRRRRLKVMRNQSVDPQPTPAKSEDEYTATGTDFSDQRSDDEYCPCDTCLKKKMASKPVVPVEMFNSAPVMMDFDLRRILQIKKSAPNNEKTKSECKVTKMDDAEENVALEAVKEEDDREVTDASSAQESEKEDDKDRKSDDCEKKEDTFEKQSDTSLKKDMNEEVEVISSMEVFEVGEMSENNMTAEQQKEAEKEKEEKADNEADSENDNLSGDVSDAMQVETERGKTKELAQEEHTEHNRYNADESENDETVDDEIAGKEQNVESVDADGSTSEKSVEQTAEAETAGETETAEDETAEEGDISEVKTASESETAEDKPAEEGDTAQDETAEEGETSEVKFAEESETAEDETAENGETSEVNSAEESKSSEAETTEVGEASEAKTAEESETAEDRAAVESETAEDETGEEGETSEVKTAEESETAEDETAENGETSEVNSAEESKTAEAETTEVGETSEAKTAEESETAEDETEEESETSEVKTAEESETAEDEIAEKSEMDEDETAEEVDISEVKTAEEYETVEDETAEKSETAEDDTLEESETAEDKAAEEGRTSQDETAEESETAEDEAAEEGEISQDETAEESETAEDKAAEEGEISQDETAEEGEISQDETAEEGETAEDKAAEEGETSQDNTAEESETAEDKAAEEGEISQDETAEESETAEDKVAEEGEISQDETAEESETAEDKAAEEGEISQDETAEESETAEDKVAEEGETSQDETAADDDLSEAKTADENETAENESAEKTEEDGETAESETAEEVTAENSESVAIETAEDEQHSEDEATEKSETAEDDTAGDDQTAEDETAEKSQTEDETAEEGETANDDTQEELETSINASIEHDKTAGENDTAADEETAEAKSATESETLDEETATDGQSAERESAEDDKTTEDEQNVETSARNMETSDHETSDEVEPFVKDGEPAEAKTAHESEMANDEGETNDKNTNSTDNKDELVAERVTADDKSTDDDTTEDVSSKAEEVLTEDEENAGEDLSERKKTAEEDTPESHSELEEVKETVDHKKDVLSNPDDTDCDDVIDLKADKIVAEEETLFKNEGDVVIDSIDEKDKGSGKEDDVEEALGDKGCHFADIGESAEGGDEAEDDTEPDMEIDEGEHDGNVQASQSTLKPKQEDGKTVTSFDVAVNHNLVYDADVEDSETEVHNQIQELSSESESKPQKTVRKTFKMLIHTLAFLKPTATQRPKAGEEEEGDDEEEHEETPEESDNTEDSSCVEKEECRKEKGELSDITEDLEEENQETETGNTTKYYSEKSEWESSENALEKQFTMSSMESQPGSFDEVLDDEVNSQTVSNHVTAKANQ